MLNTTVIEVRRTDIFVEWLRSLRDEEARLRIQVRIDRLAFGNPGDVKSLGGGLSELRISYGPGYRVYFAQRGRTLVIILAGGDKRTQAKDIARARTMLKEL